MPQAASFRSFRLPASSHDEISIPLSGMIARQSPASCRGLSCGAHSKLSLLGGFTVAKKKAAKKAVKKVAKKPAKKAVKKAAKK
jgi:hypothetical protein